MAHDSSSEPKDDNLPPLAKRFLWADSPVSVGTLIKGLAVLCVVLFVFDLFYHRHAYAPGEGLPGFYAVVGFVAFTGIVLGAKQLRRLILRNENYYAPYSIEPEAYPESGLETLQHADLHNKLDSMNDPHGTKTSGAESSHQEGDPS